MSRPLTSVWAIPETPARSITVKVPHTTPTTTHAVRWRRTDAVGCLLIVVTCAP